MGLPIELSDAMYAAIDDAMARITDEVDNVRQSLAEHRYDHAKTFAHDLIGWAKELDVLLGSAAFEAGQLDSPQDRLYRGSAGPGTLR